MTDALVNRLLWVHMHYTRIRHWHPIRRALRRPREVQLRVLRSILRRNRGTRFGREHGFEAIRSHQAYAGAVPVQTYETLRPYVEEQEREGTAALNVERPVLYAETSGTTGSPKLIPVLRDSLSRHRRNQSVQTYLQWAADREAFHGKLLLIASPAVEGTLASGTPYGSTSGHIYRSMPALARTKYVVPHEVFTIAGHDLKYLVILRLALACPDITAMASANPSTFLRLHSVLLEHRHRLREEIVTGAMPEMDRLAPDVRAAVEPRLHCTAVRARELAAALDGPAPTYEDLWPGLRLVNTWTAGSCGIALGALRTLLPSATRVSELGYLSSEFRGTITADQERNLGAPTVWDNFFEFVECDDWDAGRRDVRLVDELEPGRQYQVLITTGAGLYRYFMNDVVEVTGRFEATPTLAFLRKGKGVTSITGEKLYEDQVIAAMRSAQEEVGLTVCFFVLLADVEASRYRLVVEAPAGVDVLASGLAVHLERELARRNVEYAAKRASGRLRELEVLPVAAGTGDAYKRHCVERGVREGQFKVLILQYQDECSFAFPDYRLAPAEPA